MMGTIDLGGRLPLQPPAGLKPDARLLYDSLAQGRLRQAAPFTSRTDAGELIGPFNALLYVPAIGGAFIDFHEAEEHATPLSKRVHEIVILSVGAAWASAYEIYAHEAVAARAGFSPDIVAKLAAGEECDRLDKDERTAQRFTLELARNRCRRCNLRRGRRAFGREGLVALTLLAAAYTATCMVLNAFAVPAPPD